MSKTRLQVPVCQPLVFAVKLFHMSWSPLVCLALAETWTLARVHSPSCESRKVTQLLLHTIAYMMLHGQLLWHWQFGVTSLLATHLIMHTAPIFDFGLIPALVGTSQWPYEGVSHAHRILALWALFFQPWLLDSWDLCSYDPKPGGELFFDCELAWHDETCWWHPWSSLDIPQS